jgi:hypothetical protein
MPPASGPSGFQHPRMRHQSVFQQGRNSTLLGGHWPSLSDRIIKRQPF